MHTSRHDWVCLFDPAAHVPVLPGQIYGYGQHPEAASFFVVFDGVDGSAVRAYDYDGRPLNVDQPLLRPDGVDRFLSWGDLGRLYQAQQAAGR